MGSFLSAATAIVTAAGGGNWTRREAARAGCALFAVGHGGRVMGKGVLRLEKLHHTWRGQNRRGPGDRDRTTRGRQRLWPPCRQSKGQTRPHDGCWRHSHGSLWTRVAAHSPLRGTCKRTAEATTRDAGAPQTAKLAAAVAVAAAASNSSDTPSLWVTGSSAAICQSLDADAGTRWLRAPVHTRRRLHAQCRH